MKTGEFEVAYKVLNPAQRRAVDALEGPVMVIAGPGTGKTQVLAVRIANILQKTDTPANGILCLTFTRAGVAAMRERLARYVGPRAREVTISTFHSFALTLIEKHYALLDFDSPPLLLDEQHTVALIDELLLGREWQHLRPRGDAAKYFADLRSLISLLKRERLTAEQFLSAIETDSAVLSTDPESISSRGETKGQLKKEIQKKIEGLNRTREVVQFYELYESLKRERGLLDYDDVLEYAVLLAEQSEEVRAELRENFLYVLVDEHQDSSGVQNGFLRAVWGDVERPNLFVVGDDRQLIYGFGGASLSYFEEFKTVFGKSELITLTENYRSTAPILALADELLQSTLTTEKLSSNRAGNDSVGLFEYTYQRDEIIGAALHFKAAIASGTAPEACALLVPKNRHIRDAVQVFRDHGLPVRSVGSVSLFSLPESKMLSRVLGIIANPYDRVAIAASLFDTPSGIPPLDAHRFLRTTNPRVLSVEVLLAEGQSNGLFDDQDPVHAWGKKLSGWITLAHTVGISSLVHQVGTELLVDSAHDHETLLRRIEVVRTMLHLASAHAAEHPNETLAEFLEYLARLETYGQVLPVATLMGGKGISILTLHSSKGLEYEQVWIAHMNESVLMAQKRMNFALPELVVQLVEARDRAVATREVYVAITRAKASCTISYAKTSSTGAALELAHLIADLPETHFIKKTAEETEAALVALNPRVYVSRAPELTAGSATEALVQLVREEYAERKVSVTLLNNFFECPWKWYFRNLLQLPEIKTEHQLFGSAVHASLEALLKGTLPPKEKLIHAALYTFLEKEGVKDGAALARLVREGVASVLRWAAQYLPHVAADHTAERSVTYRDPQFSHLTLYGKIDLTERFPDGSITVTDFKTGSAKTAGVIEKPDEEERLSSYLRQLAMYSYLVYGAEKGKEVRISRLLFVEEEPREKNAVYSTHITESQIELLKRDIFDYDALVASGEWMNRPCCFKPYGKETECEYCKWAQEVYGILKK